MQREHLMPSAGWKTTIKRICFAVTLLTLPFLFYACDAVAEYSIDNRSERSLVTWPAFETCAKVGASHERLDRQTVAARSTQEYFRTFAPWTDNVKCVVVTTEDGGLLRAEEYKYGTTYVIDESAAPRGPVSMGQEYDDSLWSAAAKGSVSAILTLAIPFALIGGMAVIGGVLGIRSATRYRGRKKTL